MPIQRMLFPEDDLQECIPKERVKDILNTIYSNGKKAKEYEKKINDKTITQEEIVDLIYLFLNDFSTVGIKFFRLYQGVYKKAINALMENFPDTFIKELIKQMEASTISKLFSGIMKRLEVGQEGSRGVKNCIQALDLAVQFLENKSIDQTDAPITIVQQFNCSDN